MKTPARRLLAAAALGAALASPILAQQRPGGGFGGGGFGGGERLPPECRAEIVKLCGSAGRGGLRSCLAEKAGQLSEGCRASIRARIEERMQQRGGGGGVLPGGPATPAPAPSPAPTPQTLAYGPDSLQALDLWVPAGARKAPLVVFVHGGGWQRGSKDNATGRAMPAHMLAEGYAFASIDYRLVPRNSVEEQAGDVAQALAFLLKRADSLGIDPTRVVLTGHSAGAQLVALVGTDERYLRKAGLSFRDIRGVMPNDGAAYDVAAQIAGTPGGRMADVYRRAFGTDPARHAALSPTAHASAPNAPAFLLLHAERPDAVAQSATLAAALRQAGTAVEVAGVPGRGLLGHLQINRRLGQGDYAATVVMDNWLKKVFAG